MSQPDTRRWDYREDLGLRVEEIDLEMQRLGYVAHRVLPIMTRARNEGKVPRVPLEQMLQNLDTRRAEDGTYPRSKMTWTDDDYATVEHGLEAPMDQRMQNRYDDILDAEENEGRRIEHTLLTSYEREVNEYVTDPTNFAGRTGILGTTAGFGGTWSDRLNSTPIDDIDFAREQVYEAYGEEPDTLVIDRSTLRDLANSTQIVERAKYQNFADQRSGQAVNDLAVAVALDLPNIVVANAMFNAANPGANRNLQRIWPRDKALLLRVGDSSDQIVRGYGRTIVWDEEGATDGDQMGIIAESYYEDNRRGDVIRRRGDWGIKIWHEQAGYLIQNTYVAP